MDDVDDENEGGIVDDDVDVDEGSDEVKCGEIGNARGSSVCNDSAWIDGWRGMFNRTACAVRTISMLFTSGKWTCDRTAQT